jgi:hypothetical protein
MPPDASNWPGAVALCITAIMGFLTVCQQMQNKAMRGRLTSLERDHADCIEHVNTAWPSDADEFMAQVATLHAALKLEGRRCTLRDVAMVLRRRQRAG